MPVLPPFLLLAPLVPCPALGGDVLVDRDDVIVTESCTLRFPDGPVEDANGDGVVHVLVDGIAIDLGGGTLRGAPADRAPDRLAGLGVRIEGEGVTVRNGAVEGFRGAVLARGADGLVLEDLDVSGNFRQRLRSTPEAEDAGDWLSPHQNDENEWFERYGAGIWVEDARDVTVRRCRARRGQNGLVLDRVEDSRVYDNDFSFLSGWGIALWRSNGNTITRNACDFCVRGYSHGVYNRGQDSAGILLFEQCSRNVVAENSATHCGDGFFGFAGQEALGVHPAPNENFDLEGRGNNKNVLADNDFSYAAAHGIEMTFSFRNAFVRNRLVGNAICGIWAGFSQGTEIGWNHIERNGDAGYGRERGGINIEHGRGNQIVENIFRENACGVRLFWEEDAHLADLPWVAANGFESTDTIVVLNRFERDEVAIEIERSTELLVSDNEFFEVAKGLEVDDASTVDDGSFGVEVDYHEGHELLGETRPVGARSHLYGREHIRMTEWGPYDWVTPYLSRAGTSGEVHRWDLLGDVKLRGADVLAGEVDTGLDFTTSTPSITVAPRRMGVHPYRVVVRTDGGDLEASGVLVWTNWSVVFFAFQADPREDLAAWRAEARVDPVRGSVPSLYFPFGGGGPSDLPGIPSEVIDAKLPADHFGAIAAAQLHLPAGRWRLRTRSDDGVRVQVDGEVVIERWTHHAPETDEAILEREEHGDVVILVEYFELGGHAELSLELEQVEP